ncbi:hypothetical protein DXP75_14425 [Listeria monocytogenes]|nr:hypothetical protein [Listeria monocytogenes]MCX83204.1 hypothetical protein [Listeria monocytogenes]
MIWVGFVVHFFYGNNVPLCLHLVMEFAGVRFALPFWFVRPLFYGNNAPLRYALYWSSREADYASLELQ